MKTIITVLVYTFIGVMDTHTLIIIVKKIAKQLIKLTVNFDFTISIHLDNLSLFQPVFHNDGCKGIYYMYFPHTLLFKDNIKNKLYLYHFIVVFLLLNLLTW